MLRVSSVWKYPNSKATTSESKIGTARMKKLLITDWRVCRIYSLKKRQGRMEATGIEYSVYCI